MMAARSMTKMKNPELAAADALAASQAVGFSKELDFQHIILKGDALQVVNVMNFTEHNFCRYEQLMDDARTTIVYLSSCKIVYIYWEANSAAHGLAKAAVKQVINKIWLEEISSRICDVLFKQSTLFS